MVLREYPFLLLGLSLAALAAGALVCRRDLSRPVALSACAALPFALTERLFYPAYWRPRFLFGLADVLGFGLEDLLFVTALAALGVVSYPVVADRSLSVPSLGWPLLRRAAAVIGGTLAMSGGLLLLTRLPVVVTAVLAMLVTALVLLALRRDLALPAAVGGAVTGAAYFACCLFLAWAVPGVFQTTWNPAALSGLDLAGVPLEEVAYGAAAGLAGTLFYPSVTASRFLARTREAQSP